MLADSHCHILDPKLDDRRGEILSALKDGRDGLEFIVEISAAPAESLEAAAFAREHEGVYCTIGVHPICANLYSDEFEDWAVRACAESNSKIVAVGEVGLDYYHMDNPKELQKQVFVRQILLADKLNLPLVVHTRDAFEDTLEILTEHRAHIRNGLLIHCFSYGAEQVKQLGALDAYFAFGGAITYKKNTVSDAAIRAVPRNRLLVETDCPYLAPEPLRGKINEPKNVKLVAEHIAKVLNLTTDEVGELTLNNTKRFYKLA